MKLIAHELCWPQQEEGQQDSQKKEIKLASIFVSAKKNIPTVLPN